MTNKILSAKIVKVIEVKATCGTGTEGDPYRTVTQYRSLKGRLLAEHDEIKVDVREVGRIVAEGIIKGMEDVEANYESAQKNLRT